MIYNSVASAIIGIEKIESEKLRREADKREYEAFLKHIEQLPDEQREAAIRLRAEGKEKRRLEHIEERRHQEICSAIRSTKFTLF